MVELINSIKLNFQKKILYGGFSQIRSHTRKMIIWKYISLYILVVRHVYDKIGLWQILTWATKNAHCVIAHRLRTIISECISMATLPWAHSTAILTNYRPSELVEEPIFCALQVRTWTLMWPDLGKPLRKGCHSFQEACWAGQWALSKVRDEVCSLL